MCGLVLCARLFDKEYHVEGSRLQRFAWFRRKQELHFVHHRHANCNFAVIHFFWDRILGTYRRPDAADSDEWTLRIGGPDGCSAIRNGRRCLNSPITLRHGSSHPRAYRLRRPRPLPPQRHLKDQPPNRFSAAFAISSPMRLRMTGLSSIGSSSYGGRGSCDGEST